MKKLMSFAVFCLTALIIVSLFSCKPKAPKANLVTEIDSLSYAYGISVTQGLDQYLLQSYGIDEADKDEFLNGFLEGIKIKKDDTKTFARIIGTEIGRRVAVDMYSGINTNVFGTDSTQSLNKSQFIAGFIASFQNKRMLMKKEDADMYAQMKSAEFQAKTSEKMMGENQAFREQNQAFLEENKTKEGVITLPSGLQYKVIKESTGPKPKVEDNVKVKYRGTDIEGVEFDSNDEAVFGLGMVIAGWTEGLQLMSVGSKYMFYIPYDIAYGERGNLPNIKPFATLIFEVELLEIVK